MGDDGWSVKLCCKRLYKLRRSATKDYPSTPVRMTSHWAHSHAQHKLHQGAYQH